MGDNEIIRSIGRMEGKIDLLIDMHHEDRLRIGAVEKKVWGAFGTAGIAFIVGVMHKLGLPVQA